MTDNSIAGAVEVTVLYPCLNEEDAIGGCVQAALNALKEGGLAGEVLVVDNNSTDESAKRAEAAGARVVVERRRGYGSAYLRGLKEARGEYVVMLDADGTYPTEMIPQFVQELKEGGHQMVVGNRFSGNISQGAMPLLNRYVGNPILSGMTRLLYRVGLKDIHCGMRAIRRSAAESLELRTPGMEFATEMIVKALDHGLKVKQLPIPYRPRIGETKLRRFHDAWRHIEYMLVFSPTALFLFPGLSLYLLGLAVQLTLLFGPREIWFRTWDHHTNLAGMAASLSGTTLLVLGVLCCTHAHTIRMHFRHSWLARQVVAHAGKVMAPLGVVLFLVGMAMWGSMLVAWLRSGMGELHAVPILSLATTLAVTGFEMVSGTFVMNMLSHRGR